MDSVVEVKNEEALKLIFSYIRENHNSNYVDSQILVHSYVNFFTEGNLRRDLIWFYDIYQSVFPIPLDLLDKLESLQPNISVIVQLPSEGL